MNKNVNGKLDLVLSAIATHYMISFQGDILLDHQTIVERLQENHEIECYVAQTHFDTEKRFQYNGAGEIASVEEARKRARADHWGEYIVKFSTDGVTLMVEVEQAIEGAPIFPLDRIADYTESVVYINNNTTLI